MSHAAGKEFANRNSLCNTIPITLKIGITPTCRGIKPTGTCICSANRKLILSRKWGSEKQLTRFPADLPGVFKGNEKV